MQCYVYKGSRQADNYLYLKTQIESATVPPALLEMLGDLSLVIEFELTAQSSLVQAEVEQVMSDIEQHGFYLQMPKKDMRAVEERFFN